MPYIEQKSLCDIGLEKKKKGGGYSLIVVNHVNLMYKNVGSYQLQYIYSYKKKFI